MATQVKEQSAAHAPESTSGDKAAAIIGTAAVLIGVFGFGLLIWFGM